MKIVSEATPSQYIVSFGNTEPPTCMPLSGHFMDIEGLSRHFMDIGGRVLVHQTEKYQLSLTYYASW